MSSNENQFPIFAIVKEKISESDVLFISRCFDLARRGIGHVSPNPPVGAVLVYQDRILGEGYHHAFGGPHAEVNAIRNVAEKDRHLISSSTLYVSLEPCCITNKTGPCTDLIIQQGIKDVRVSMLDPNPAVAGKGMQLLKSNNINTLEGILKEEGKALIRPFTTNILLERPHLILKWAQSKHGYAGIEGEQIWLSEPSTKTWSHHQRAIVDAIMVGARTVETDNPSLTTRDFPGKSSKRVVFDPSGRLTSDFKVFNNDGCAVHYYSLSQNDKIKGGHIRKVQLKPGDDILQQVIQDLYQQQIGMLLIEGGPSLHKLFVKQNLWDEAWVIQSKHSLDHGLSSPNVHGKLIGKEKAGTDTILGILNDNRG